MCSSDLVPLFGARKLVVNYQIKPLAVFHVVESKMKCATIFTLLESVVVVTGNDMVQIVWACDECLQGRDVPTITQPTLLQVRFGERRLVFLRVLNHDKVWLVDSIRLTDFLCRAIREFYYSHFLHFSMY